MKKGAEKQDNAIRCMRSAGLVWWDEGNLTYQTVSTYFVDAAPCCFQTRTCRFTDLVAESQVAF